MRRSIREDSSEPRPPSGVPVEVLCGPVLYHLRTWSEAEWAAMSDSDRPALSKHAPGLGWLGAVPVQWLN